MVVAYGTPELLLSNIVTLDLARTPHIVVIVENFKTDRDRGLIAEICNRDGWVLLQMNGNAGFGAAVNAGAARAELEGCDTLLLLNPDARIEEPAIAALQTMCRSDTKLIVGPRILRPDGTIWSDGNLLDRRTGAMPATNNRTPTDPRRYSLWLTGACLMTTPSFWLAAGGMDEGYFLYWEDVDMAERCRRSGGTLEIRRDLVASHDVGGTQSAVSGKSNKYYYYNCRNRIVFATKNLTAKEIWAWVKCTPTASFEIVRRGGPRSVAGNLGRVLAGFAGSVVGLAVAARHLTLTFLRSARSWL